MKILILLLTLFSINITLAGQDTGGGDPKVAEFLSGAKSVCQWMNKKEGLSSYVEKCFSEVNDLSDSVNSIHRKPRISSTDELVLDDGAEKDAITNVKEKTILIQRQRWEAATLDERRMTSAMEMALLIGIPRRYDLAQMFLKDVGAQSSSDPCTQVYEAMSSLIDSYIEVIKSCYALEQAGKTKTPAYKEELKMAKSIEDSYSRSVKTCNHVCENKNVCNGPSPEGACRK